MTPKIDHIIVRLPYADLQNPPEWLTKNFTISPGGRHADNRTENKLIVFADGSYIELIAFIDDLPSNAEGHWWGAHDPGFIDWALTSSSPDDVKVLQDQLSSTAKGAGRTAAITYDEPREGGRTKPDGTELRWVVTFPLGARRGEMPFWCHDVTARKLRVPTDVHATSHPCGALGVGEVTVLAPAGARLEGLRKAYAAVLGGESVRSGERSEWEVEALVKEGGVQRPVVVLVEALTRRVESGKGKEYGFISEIALLTDTIGLGQSRESILETLGGEEVIFNFIHGRRA